MIGQTISHYRIDEHLGGGGMGVVYKAVDLRLNRPVALKFLAPELTRDVDANQRFRHEAQAASGLDHPNICTIHEIDETPDQQLFIALAYYEGETLKKRISRGPLSVEAALDIAIQIAQGLSRAHQSGLVHRDIKPANVMITAEGLVKIVDFGLAKLTSDPDVTRTGSTMGTVAYMSPEQARGGPAESRTDVWALGVVLYEMLAGVRPFRGDDEVAVLASVLEGTAPPLGQVRPEVPAAVQRIVARALDRDLASRYPSGAELLSDLVACRTAIARNAQPAPGVLQVLRRPWVAVPLAAALILAAVPAALWYRRVERARRAREETIPQITRLVASGDFMAAFDLAEQVERDAPSDPVLADLWPRLSVVASVVTTPDGAEVYLQPYESEGPAWEHVGRTPIRNARLPRGVFRLRIEKEGFTPRLIAERNPGVRFGNLGAVREPLEIALEPTGSNPGMVPVAGGAFPVPLASFNLEELVALEPFTIDAHEVTNREFKRFVDAGGYTRPDDWRDVVFIDEGRQLTWQDAMRRLVDPTGRPGPATWELGAYPAGQDDVPVGGVSWYEARAYCASQGKELSTLYQWARAALAPREGGSALATVIIPASNFAGKGPAPVGRYRGVGPYGTVDMAGNVREWVWNESSGDRRWVLGGAWNDPDYTFVTPYSLPPFDRSPTNGIRCSRPGASGSDDQARLRAAVEISRQDYRAIAPVSDEVYQVFARQLSYSHADVTARVDARDESGSDWIKETISFDTGYEPGRTTAYLFVPRSAQPPFQTVVGFPGLGPFVSKNSSGTFPFGNLWDYLIRSGRVVVVPIWKGSFERWDPFLSLTGDEYMRGFRARVGHWRQDLGRLLDALAERPDIDMQRLAYVGQSFGASTPLPLLALEDRLRAAVLIAGGFPYRAMPPEAHGVNYAPRITIPVLLVGGRYDYLFPLESSQEPLFNLLRTRPEDKRHVVFDAGHSPTFPRSEVIREVLGWYDRYLGPVRTGATQ
jgi:formylglycine-generating enzyme required for sulfatase activity/dienelactone hydrolase